MYVIVIVLSDYALLRDEVVYKISDVTNKKQSTNTFTVVGYIYMIYLVVSIVILISLCFFSN